jgi:hypothetical protein
MVSNNFFLKRTTAPLTIATVLLAFGWFYYFLDIGSLHDAILDLGRNPVGANMNGSHIHEDSLSVATGKDGEDGEDALSIINGQGRAIADGGNGGTAITSGSTGSTASTSGGNGGEGGNGGDGGNGGSAINFNSPGSSATGGNGGNGGDGGVPINIPS